MLNLIILNESKVLKKKKSIWHMPCGTTEALLSGWEANKYYLEGFTCIGEESFGQTYQAALLKSSSSFKAHSSRL